MIPLIRSLAMVAALLSLSSCAHPVFQKKEETIKAAEPPPLFSWDGASISGKPKVVINLEEQKARIFDNGIEVAWTYVATGTDSHPTPTGVFRISEKKVDKKSNTWGIIVDSSGDTVNWNANSRSSNIPEGGRFVGAPMPNWMRLTNGGIGMHGGPIPNPGSPASHGCIRLPYAMAERMYEELPSGTPVTIMN
jgi:lipoprotein-anchoring transpeptidase ErfK/SrfK